MLQRLARLLFQACPSAQTAQLKRFLHTVVVPGGYGENLSVNLCDVPRELRLLAPPPAVPASPLAIHSRWLNCHSTLLAPSVLGATPKLILYDKSGSEISREDVPAQLGFDQLHTWVQQRGFMPQPGAAAAAAVAGPQQQQHFTHSSAAATTGGSAGPVLLPDASSQQRDGSAVMRRRRLRLGARAAVAGSLRGAGAGRGAPGAPHHMRQRQRVRGAGADRSSGRDSSGSGDSQRMRRRRPRMRTQVLRGEGRGNAPLN